MKKKNVLLVALLAIFTSQVFASEIHEAIKKRDIGLVMKLLKENPDCINEVSELDETPLCLICFHFKKNTSLVKMILQKECREKTINRANHWGDTPLYFACKNNNLKTFKLLFPKSTLETINKAYVYNETTLLWACRNNNTEMIKTLLPKCTPETMNQANMSGETPLYLAYKNKNREIVKLFLSHNIQASTNKADAHEKTLLLLACKRNDVKMVKKILPLCTSKIINQADSDDNMPLFWIDNSNNGNTTPLWWACANNNSKMVKMLLPQCNPETTNKADVIYKATPLWLACKNNSSKIASWLLQHGALEKIDVANNNGETPLCRACKNNNLEVTLLLLKYGALKTINMADNNDKAPLYWTCCYHRNQKIKDLLLYYACKNNNMTIVQQLLLHGATITDRRISLINDLEPNLKNYIKVASAYDKTKTTRQKIELVLANKKLCQFLLKLSLFRSAYEAFHAQKNLKATTFSKLCQNLKKQDKTIVDADEILKQVKKELPCKKMKRTIDRRLTKKDAKKDRLDFSMKRSNIYALAKTLSQN